MRLFIGVSPDAKTRDALAETARMLAREASGRYTDPALYHLTLAFLGEVSADSVPSALAAMRDAATGVSPFRVSLSAVGRFGSVLWRGVRDDAALVSLANALRASLDAAGLPYDRKPFRAHFTLAREASFPASAWQGVYPEADFPVRSLILYESARPGGKLSYLPLGEVPLG